MKRETILMRQEKESLPMPFFKYGKKKTFSRQRFITNRKLNLHFITDKTGIFTMEENSYVEDIIELKKKVIKRRKK